MLKRYFLTSAAVVCAAAMTSAQTPTTGGAPQIPPAIQSTRPSPQSTTSDRAPERSSMTLTGCLAREQDVPGHSPNDADHAGRMNDYILTAASSAQSESRKPGSSAPGAVGTSGTAATATAHTGAMYKIKGLSEMQLKALAGKRVEVVGLMNTDTKQSSQAAAAKTPATGSGSQTQTGTEANAGHGEEKTAWPSFAAASIREIPGSCAPASSNR